MRNRFLRGVAAGALLLPLSLYQSCLVLFPDVPGAVVVDLDRVPHFDGDDEGSFVDRIFGFDDDDDDWDDDDWDDDWDDDDWDDDDWDDHDDWW